MRAHCGNRHILIIVFLSLLTISLSTNLKAAPKATGNVYFQGGQAYPQKDLVEFVEPATAFRLKLFGGAKVQTKFVGAVGLGWDLTYSDHEIKGDSSAAYRRITWDWFYLPISFGFFHFTPGLAWVVTDIDSELYGIKETSVRPALILDTGISIAILNNFGIALNGRVSRTIIDKETMNSGREINIVGDYASWFLGAFLYF